MLRNASFGFGENPLELRSSHQGNMRMRMVMVNWKLELSLRKTSLVFGMKIQTRVDCSIETYKVIFNHSYYKFFEI